ncbi:CRISPR-associated endoribonuclease Cas2 1 [Alicyclobacillus cellulosilyticus]|uniref:CRISPR-associated endoribonuclease Cas2 n=1 Tax=Alicyclobacillus cellulosilyticus TaxID=1003997 RepID=A0A917NJI6_9BACL|nr:CRISPR-associated endonuclease Cas2 [Alicyclobacillus cellulosilyticus]GGJ05170.1 CRISPR-associated endoribonuclease Cas2 1 [Alicyclobacillus cellulosilyticus]
MRRYVLVSYDVSDPKRWRRVYKVMRGYGQHVQYSVFLCQLTDTEEARLRETLYDLIHKETDQVLFARLGSVESDALDRNLTVIGREYDHLDLKKLIF